MRLRSLVGVALLGWSSYRLIVTLSHRPGIDDQIGELAQRWWPLVIVMVGVAMAARLLAGRHALRGPFTLIVVGLALLAVTLEPLGGVPWTDAVLPVLVLPLGWALVASRPAVKVEHARTVHHVVLANSRVVIPTSQALSEVRLVVVAGGIDLDLTAAATPQAARDAGSSLPWAEDQLGHGLYVDVSAVFGGVDLTIPDGWFVQLDAKPWLGRIGPRQQNPTEHITGRVTVSGWAFLGDVVIRRVAVPKRQQPSWIVGPPPADALVLEPYDGGTDQPADAGSSSAAGAPGVLAPGAAPPPHASGSPRGT